MDYELYNKYLEENPEEMKKFKNWVDNSKTELEKVLTKIEDKDTFKLAINWIIDKWKFFRVNINENNTEREKATVYDNFDYFINIECRESKK